MSGARPLLGYIVPDLSDPAVHRRLRMFRDAGAEVRLAGFRRSISPVPDVSGVVPIDLGATANGALVDRVGSILKQMARSRALRGFFDGIDALVVRNLDMLALAAWLGRGHAVPSRIYECLDIHSLMLGQGVPSRLARGLERRLAAGVDGLLTSSPAFDREYFRGNQGIALPTYLIENKIPADYVRTSSHARSAPPWRIGWFGQLRCRKSLMMLRDLSERMAGRLHCTLAGKVNEAEIDDFAEIVTASDHLDYLGPYAHADVGDLYRSIDLCWAIDYTQEGLNSSWLLPNRIYEATANHVPAIALGDVESGRWLRSHGIGVIIANPVRDLSAFLDSLTPGHLAALSAAAAAVPRSAVVALPADDAALLAFCLDPAGSAPGISLAA